MCWSTPPYPFTYTLIDSAPTTTLESNCPINRKFQIVIQPYTSIKRQLRRINFGIKLTFLLPRLLLIKSSNHQVSTRMQSSVTDPSGLAELFVKHGSDKATMHDYWLIYGEELALLSDDKPKVLEIGLGTNNPEIPSNMGGHFNPGGSIRAFKEFLPKAQIYGADIDREILFNEDRIETCWVDQTQEKSFSELYSLIKDQSLDVIIIDGLHQPYADLLSVFQLIKFLKIKGSIFVEDIEDSPPVRTIWFLVTVILRIKGFKSKLFEMKGGLMFWIQRVD